MKIVVTGCAGFIGANFSNYWLDSHSQDTVIGIDCLTYAANIPALSKLKNRERFRFYKANICDKQAVEQIFLAESPDALINFAAESHVDNSIENSRIFVETNVLGTQTLLDLCLKHGIKRFHQVSTDEVYGDLPLDSEDAFTEASLLSPSSPYSASKAAADLLVLSYYKTHGLSVSISRSANNYGKYQHREKLIPKAIRCALHNESIPIYGNGSNIRDWIHVEDHCRAIEKIVCNAASGSIYNVGGSAMLSNITLVKEILALMNKPQSLIAFVADRKGHDRKYALNCNKLICELDWRPEVSFSDGLAETVEWYTMNE
ncbi:MAG: dTDP-glucose 4,6-dehydratase [Clostridia bacterium]|nr:dTDP-glucose 4,6-dehydratase [Clostridia bacterium]